MVGLQGTAEGDGARERKRGLVFFVCFGGGGNKSRQSLGEEAPGCGYRRAGTGGGGGRRCSWPWMQTDRQGNQRQAVTFSAAGGSKALFKGLVNAGCC